MHMSHPDPARDATNSASEEALVFRSEPKSRFYPVKGKNVSIEKIVEGMLLSEIEIVPIPEYGVHL
ncbi:hypothetical protein E1180_15360 [Roseibium denhamense]|uniref:Uncharacterized protein n=1 Tax=Roseibium denhamense TaxID=76305 RepID=A0ABY1PLI7_9HYPH|nr:hypothetical protein [Roseibium denhamense]MTI06890.1 hypothetical protein [Roseibium denhamense]SMP36808.1 hypothetical protein SAMN06265374_4333 [Roseibium denhamense]